MRCTLAGHAHAQTMVLAIFHRLQIWVQYWRSAWPMSQTLAEHCAHVVPTSQTDVVLLMLAFRQATGLCHELPDYILPVLKQNVQQVPSTMAISFEDTTDYVTSSAI